MPSSEVDVLAVVDVLAAEDPVAAFVDAQRRERPIALPTSGTSGPTASGTTTSGILAAITGSCRAPAEHAITSARTPS